MESWREEFYASDYGSEYLMHYRTKGSKNGISRTEGYKAIGQLASSKQSSATRLAAQRKRLGGPQAPSEKYTRDQIDAQKQHKEALSKAFVKSGSRREDGSGSGSRFSKSGLGDHTTVTMTQPTTFSRVNELNYDEKEHRAVEEERARKQKELYAASKNGDRKTAEQLKYEVAELDYIYNQYEEAARAAKSHKEAMDEARRKDQQKKQIEYAKTYVGNFLKALVNRKD